MFLLLSRLETGTGLKLYIIDASREDVIGDLLAGPRSGDRQSSTGCWRRKGHGTRSAGLYMFAPDGADTALLERWQRLRTAAGPFSFRPPPRSSRRPMSRAEKQSWETIRGSPVAECNRPCVAEISAAVPYGAKTSSTDLFGSKRCRECRHTTGICGAIRLSPRLCAGTGAYANWRGCPCTPGGTRTGSRR